MANFDDILNKAKEMADAAAQKTGEVLEISKLKVQELKLLNNIQKAYCELGSLYYNSVKFGGGSEEQINTCISNIDKLIQEQEAVKNSAEHIGSKHSRYCTVCGCENSADGVFCTKCGSSLTQKTE